MKHAAISTPSTSAVTVSSPDATTMANSRAGPETIRLARLPSPVSSPVAMTV
ncbi:MAG: hypothetical protein R2855_07750 [Thermomicrobiales bacterium]